MRTSQRLVSALLALTLTGSAVAATSKTLRIESPEMTDSDVQEVRDLFQAADAVNSSKQLALKYYEEAKDALNEMKDVMNASELEFFEDLLNFVYERKF